MRYLPEYWNDIELVITSIPKIEHLFNKTVLITGATGMVCSAIVDTLSYLNHNKQAGIKIILAGRSKSRLIKRFKDCLHEEEFRYLEFDATKCQSFNEKVDFIIYGASNASPAIYSKQPVETLLGNILGLNSMLELACQNKDCRLLYISSSEIYGNRTNDGHTAYKEEEYGYIDILNPRACYPNGKRAAETLCVSYGQEYNVDTTIVRLGHIYGPTITESDSRASAAFTRDVLEGRDIVMKSAGEQIRSYCYVLDCASAIITVLLSGASGNAYNISNKDSVISIREIAEELAKEGGVSVVFENPSDRERKSYNLMNNSALNSERLENLGWKALFSLSDGVKRTIQLG